MSFWSLQIPQSSVLMIPCCMRKSRSWAHSVLAAINPVVMSMASTQHANVVPVARELVKIWIGISSSAILKTCKGLYTECFHCDDSIVHRIMETIQVYIFFCFCRCYCVNKEGQRLFGEGIFTHEDEMNCSEYYGRWLIGWGTKLRSLQSNSEWSKVAEDKHRRRK